MTLDVCHFCNNPGGYSANWQGKEINVCFPHLAAIKHRDATTKQLKEEL